MQSLHCGCDSGHHDVPWCPSYLFLPLLRARMKSVLFFLMYDTHPVWWVLETHYVVHRFPRQHLQYRLQYLSYLC